MEATEGVEPPRAVVDEIVPPRLEDAGLEDCALPLASIHEAFLRAATATAVASSDEDEDEDGEGCGSGSDAPEEPRGPTGDPPPSTEDGDSKRTAEEDGASCALGLQKLEIR